MHPSTSLYLEYIALYCLNTTPHPTAVVAAFTETLQSLPLVQASSVRWLLVSHVDILPVADANLWVVQWSHVDILPVADANPMGVVQWSHVAVNMQNQTGGRMTSSIGAMVLPLGLVCNSKKEVEQSAYAHFFLERAIATMKPGGPH